MMHSRFVITVLGLLSAASGWAQNAHPPMDLRFYYASAYREADEYSTSGFINLSESYPWNYHAAAPEILPEDELGRDTIRLGQSAKKKFLDALELSNTDTAFLYNIQSDTIIKMSVQALPLMAVVNTYSRGDEGLGELDYEIGFNLGKSYSLEGTTFAYIGRESPFQAGKRVELLWEVVPNTDLPFERTDALAPKDLLPLSETTADQATFKFSHAPIDYYVQELMGKGNTRVRYLMVVNAETNTLVHQRFYWNSESFSLAPLNISDKQFREKQWSGEVLKNKPPILYGFLWLTFGCLSIDFVDSSEPPLWILCDNRH